MTKQALPGLYVNTNVPTGAQTPLDPVIAKWLVSNFRRLSTWSRSISPLMFQVDTPILGTLPNPETPQDCYVTISGSPDVSFSGGTGLYVFPQPFPNGILAAIANWVSIGPDSSSLEIQNVAGGTSLTQLSLYGTYNGSPVTGTEQVSLMVVGW